METRRVVVIRGVDTDEVAERKIVGPMDVQHDRRPNKISTLLGGKSTVRSYFLAKGRVRPDISTNNG